MKWISFPLVMCLVAAAAPDVLQAQTIDGIKYLGGVPGYTKKTKGQLLVTDVSLTFLKAEGDESGKLFTIQNHALVYVAIGGEVELRLKLLAHADMLTRFIPVPKIVFKVIPGREPKELISVEYADSVQSEAGMAVFEVRKRDAEGLKKHLDLKAKLDDEWYERRREEEEEARRAREAKTTHGTWTVDMLTRAGKKETVYIESATYEVALFQGYVGLKPEGQDWARYRIFVDKIKEKPKEYAKDLTPIFKKGVLHGFQYKENQYLLQ